MFFPYTQAAMFLVERGTDPYLIDRAISKFGMPMGSLQAYRILKIHVIHIQHFLIIYVVTCRLCDLVGFSVAIAIAAQFFEKFPERKNKSMIIPLMQEDKRAGEATRKGFYLYDDKRKAKPDPELKKYIEKARSISGVNVDPKLAKLSEKEIIEMMFLSVVNEVCRLFPEGITVKAADLDIAGIMGMDFPPYRGGIMFWDESIGSKYIYSKLNEWSNTYGDFFKPCAFLAERASEGAPLSAPVEQGRSRL